jgi:hypothetical protein
MARKDLVPMIAPFLEDLSETEMAVCTIRTTPPFPSHNFGPNLMASDCQYSASGKRSRK